MPRHLVTVSPQPSRERYKISSPARALPPGSDHSRGELPTNPVTPGGRPASSGCRRGGHGARPALAPPLPLRGDSPGSSPAISPGWPSCSPPCTARLGSISGASGYAGPAGTSPRNARSAAPFPSRPFSLRSSRRATTRSRKKTEEVPTTNKTNPFTQKPKENPISRRPITTSFGSAATSPMPRRKMTSPAWSIRCSR